MIKYFFVLDNVTMENLEIKLGFNGANQIATFLGKGELRERTLPYIELDEIIDESLEFRNKWYLENENTQNAFVASTPQELIDIMELRSKVYTPMGYNEEFPEKIQGLNFDEFDKNSISIGYRRNEGILSSSIRLNYANFGPIQSEKIYDFTHLKKRYNIAELTRFVIHPNFQKSFVDFRNMFSEAYNVARQTGINMFVYGILKDHFKMYNKFGGVEVLYEGSYGNIKQEGVNENADCLIVSWKLDDISNFFKNAILKNG